MVDDLIQKKLDLKHCFDPSDVDGANELWVWLQRLEFDLRTASDLRVKVAQELMRARLKELEGRSIGDAELKTAWAANGLSRGQNMDTAKEILGAVRTTLFEG